MRTSSHLVFGLVLLAGCTVDRFANPDYDGCENDGDCPSGEVCVRGFCVGRMDAGVDAGPPCPTQDVCYDGPEGTLGVGPCRAGCRMPVDDAGTLCVGQVVPASTESCNEVDDDCDGLVDEGVHLGTEEQCGACGNACLAGETCCADGATFACANTSSSSRFCGNCETRCSPGQACCGGTCTDIETDELNCGACNNPCAAGQQCCGGRCIDPSSSAAHCGGCGNACEEPNVCCPSRTGEAADCRPTEDCAVCEPECTEGETCCGGTCVDTQTDAAHCGACGVACAPGQRCCGGTCVDLDAACSACDDACPANSQCCDFSCTPLIDPMHCGECGNACDPLSEICCGEAGCVDPLVNNSHCGGCNNACGDGVCSNGHCCPRGQIWCGDRCIEPNTNSNCGGCGVRCAPLCACTAVGGGYACHTLFGLPC